MTATSVETVTPLANPLDVLEDLVMSNGWTAERSSDDEMVVEIEGQWSDYTLFFAWRDDLGVLQFCCTSQIRIPPNRRAMMFELLILANEKLWLGHFGLVVDEKLLTFRHALLLDELSSGGRRALQEVIQASVTECDRFHPAFQLVLWGGKSPSEALAASLLETVGEA